MSLWSGYGQVVPFPYYRHLSAKQKKVYDKSAKITRVAVPTPGRLFGAARAVSDGLERDERRAVETALNALSRELCQQLQVSAVPVKVLATRPSSARSELHGLYTRDARGRTMIRVWMRTAARSEVVKMRTFMRTFLHEVCHHLDYELFRLEDSLHTEGFFKRESSLMRQIVPKGRTSRKAAAPRRQKPTPAEEPAMDLGPNPVEAILAMLRGKGEPGDTSSAAQESSPNEAARAKAEPKAEPDPEPPDEYIDEGWWRELDEPPVDAGTAVGAECAADVQMNAEVYDPGFDAIVGAPAAASSGAVRVERPIPKGERQTKLPF